MGAAAADSARPRAPDGSSLSILQRGGTLERRLVLLMGARLALSLVSLGIALALDTTVGDVDDPGRHGLYATVAFAFLATALYGLLLPRVRLTQGFAGLNVAADIAIVSSLVHFSGGADSVFAFLYVVVALYAALLFDRRGAMISAGLGILSYGVVLSLSRFGPAEPGGAVSLRVLLAVWSLHGGAMVVVALLGSFLAVELRRAGEALRQRTTDLEELAHLHRRTVDSLMSGLLTTDREGRVTSFNPEAERITGLEARRALGRDVESVLPGLRQLGMLAETGGAGHNRARTAYRNARGDSLHLGVGAYILGDEEGRPSGHVVIFQDVTEVVAMEQELRRSERLAAVGELSASIAHEIRNPLAAISGSIQMLRREAEVLGGAASAARLMEIVLRETDRLNLLITDFLAYARPGPFEIGPVRLAGVVDDLLEIFAGAAPEGVRIEVDLPSDLSLRGDAAQLRQVLWNLVLNACQAMPQGGVVGISAAAVPPPPQGGAGGRRNGEEEKVAWVEIRVRDQGAGIPPEVLEHIFDPFFTTKPEGSGLGLATVHRIVEEHGGSIQLESSVGTGTVVGVRLPRAEGTP